MYETKLLTIDQNREWNELLGKTEQADIYFTPEYAKIYQENYGEEINNSYCGSPFLFFFGNEKEFIIYPFLKREIPFAGQEKLFDIISPYGYGGPVFKKGTLNHSKLAESFVKEFDIFCKKNRIISEFIRFHPLLENHNYFKETLNIKKENQTVFADLDKGEECLLKEMDKKTRNLMRKAEAKGVVIERSEGQKDLERFHQLYLNTMETREAPKKYFFPMEFFRNTQKFLGDKVSLFVARWQGKIIATSLFLHKYPFFHYHFSGSDKEYLRLAPNNLLLWKVMLWGKEQGYQKFHFGGGRGQDDSLFHFKAGFAKGRARFYAGRVIHDETLYRQLSRTNGTREEIDFFPYYRKP